MPTISVQLDHDLHVKVQKFANGVGVDLSELIERAIVYALSSRYPDNALPGQGGHPDQGLPGEQPGIDNTLPGGGGRPDNSLPRPPFNPEIDNELPEGEVPVDPDYGVSGDRPDQGLPGEQPEVGGGPVGGGLNPNVNPDLDPNVKAGGKRPDNTLPPHATPKR